MNFTYFLSVGAGAALGACMRWILGMIMNPIFPTLPLGTLTANLMGGFLIGASMEFFIHHNALPAEARLFVITGFLGGLTTFSTFSAETVTLLTREQYGWATLMIATHLGGSIGMTILGLLTMKWLKA